VRRLPQPSSAATGCTYGGAAVGAADALHGGSGDVGHGPEGLGSWIPVGYGRSIQVDGL
jgi:hypothetical protein